MTYNYTKPRVPISGMFSSPGPAIYTLPGLTGQLFHDPRSVHRRGPAYHLGLRLFDFENRLGPGPAYLPVSLRNGLPSSPAYSLAKRLSAINVQKFPSPAEYYVHIPHESAPKYTMAGRHPAVHKDSYPAPNHYTLDPMLGRTIRAGKDQAPAYSLRCKYTIGGIFEDNLRGPGPATVGAPQLDVYKLRPPIYSMAGRSKNQFGDGLKPGPLDHHAETVWVHKRQAPLYTFGMRHSQYSSTMASGDPPECD